MMRRLSLLLMLLLVGCGTYDRVPVPHLEQIWVSPYASLSEPLAFTDEIHIYGSAPTRMIGGFYNNGTEPIEGAVINIKNCMNVTNSWICDIDFCDSLPQIKGQLIDVLPGTASPFELQISNGRMLTGTYVCEFVVEKAGDHSKIYESKSVFVTISEVK
jgi:hypothetical protein